MERISHGKCQFLPMIIYYCSGILEGRDMSCVKHGMSFRRPCVLYGNVEGCEKFMNKK